MKGQNNVGIGTIAPNASALLDLSATDKGFLIPRTDTTTLNNISLMRLGPMVSWG
jgi:hypothetical protein